MRRCTSWISGAAWYGHAFRESPPLDPPELTPPQLAGIVRVNMTLVPLRPINRPRDVIMRGLPWDDAADYDRLPAARPGLAGAAHAGAAAAALAFADIPVGVHFHDGGRRRAVLLGGADG